jgi:hypothetical protein
MDYGLFPANVTTGSVIERNGMGKQEALSRDYQGSSTALDSLQLTDAVDDEEEEQLQPLFSYPNVPDLELVLCCPISYWKNVCYDV